MPHARSARVVVAAVVFAVASVGVAGCGRPGLDLEQQRQEARACASLIERHVAKRGGNGTITLDGKTVDLDKPDEFYRLLQQLRPPSVFRMDDARTFRYARASLVSDLCKDKSTASSASTASTASTKSDG